MKRGTGPRAQFRVALPDAPFRKQFDMASPFASLTTSEPIPLPFDEGQWVKVRKLTGKEFEHAQESFTRDLASGRKNAWSKMFRRALEGGAPDTEMVNALADPLTGFDRFVLVRKGLVAWSYDKPLTAKGAAADAVDDLDDEAVDFIAREVLRLTKPQLFLSTDEQEHERKNAIGSSTAV